MKLSRLVQNSEFFRGLGQSDIEALLDRLNGVKKTYRSGEIVVHAGFSADRLMLVASGHLHVYEQMSDDRPVLVREIGQGEALGLWILHLPEIGCWPGTIVAVENCTLISLDMARTRALLAADDPQIVVPLSANSSRMLSRELFTTWRKLMVMDAQTIEARIKIYLSELNNETGGTGAVTIPFNRERMAEYFGVARPSLSRALCQMRDRGLLTWHKNSFKINF